MLHSTLLRDDDGPKAVLLHGFSQRSEVWRAVAGQLQSFGQILALDLPGHGQTPIDYDNASIERSAELVEHTVGDLSDVTIIGYSLGARVALQLAASGARAHRFVLVGAKAAIENEVARESRREGDRATADRIEAGGIQQFVNEWLDIPFNKRLSPAQQHRELRLTNRPEGLACSLRHAGSAEQPTTAEQLAQVVSPVVLIRGSEDLPGVIADQDRLLHALPNAQLVIVEGAGHAVPFERPDAFAITINQYAAD